MADDRTPAKKTARTRKSTPATAQPPVDEIESPAGAMLAPATATANDRWGVFSRSTLLRHTTLAVVGFLLWLLVISGFNDLHNSIWLTPIAYTACAAAGLTVLVGLSGQISLGHGAFMMVGAYTTALILEHWHSSHGNLQLIPLLAAAMAVSAIFGAVVGLAAARLRGPYLAGATLAFAVGLPQIVNYHKLSSTLGGNNGVVVNSPPSPTSHFDLYRWHSFVAGVAVVVVLWVLANVSRGRLGRSFRAVRDDEVAAALCGLSVPRTQVLAFVISAGCAGLGGGLVALIVLVAGPGAFQLTLSLSLLAAVVFGGLGSLAGAIYGSIVVVLLPYWSQDLTNALSIHSNKISNNLPLLVYGVVLAVAMLAVPFGLQGALRRLRVLVTAQFRS
jgi:branched-chain amino acid transport system permease protein